MHFSVWGSFLHCFEPKKETPPPQGDSRVARAAFEKNSKGILSLSLMGASCVRQMKHPRVPFSNASQRRLLTSQVYAGVVKASKAPKSPYSLGAPPEYYNKHSEGTGRYFGAFHAFFPPHHIITRIRAVSSSGVQGTEIDLFLLARNTIHRGRLEEIGRIRGLERFIAPWGDTYWPSGWGNVCLPRQYVFVPIFGWQCGISGSR